LIFGGSIAKSIAAHFFQVGSGVGDFDGRLRTALAFSVDTNSRAAWATHATVVMESPAFPEIFLSGIGTPSGWRAARSLEAILSVPRSLPLPVVVEQGVKVESPQRSEENRASALVTKIVAVL
jgi:hypothetical protein